MHNGCSPEPARPLSHPLPLALLGPPNAPPPPPPYMSSSQATMYSDDGDREGQQPAANKPKVPRRTPMACQFCRGRKLKCDGRATCANCQRRGIACVYMPVAAQRQ